MVAPRAKRQQPTTATRRSPAHPRPQKHHGTSQLFLDRATASDNVIYALSLETPGGPPVPD